MGIFQRLFGGARTRVGDDLYHAVVARARDPRWYLDGRVPDTVDGRFDMVAAVLVMVLLRLEAVQDAEPDAAILNAALTEWFVEDMDGQLRQIGIGDVVVGKHIGKMMQMLGGRLGAYRTGLADATLDAALVRNLYRGEHPGDDAVAFAANGLTQLRAQLDGVPVRRLLVGDLG